MNTLTLFLTKNSLRLSKTHKLRFDFILMILGIIVSVTVVSAAITLFEGYQQTLKKILLDSNAHILIFPNVEHVFSPDKAENAITRLGSLPEVKSIQPVYSNTAMIKIGSKVRSCIVRSYSKDEDTNWFNKYINAGAPGIESGSVILGDKLADDLSVTVGDRITLLYPKSDNFSLLGFISLEKSFKINSVITTGYYEMDKSLILMLTKDAYSFYQINPQFTHLEINLKDNKISSASEVSDRYSGLLGHNYLVKSWIDYNGNLFSLITIEKWLIFLIFSFLILIAALNCVSIVSTSIMDRKKEIAILRTIGITLKQIKQVIYFRIILICITSIFTGLILGTLSAWIITKQSLYQLKGDVYFIDKITMHVSVINYLAVFTIAMILISVCVKIPLKQINKLEIIDVLRGI